MSSHGTSGVRILSSSAITALALLAGCGGGGGGSGPVGLPRSAGAGALLPAALTLEELDPAPGARAVPTTTDLHLRFDGTLRAESVDTDRTVLRDLGSDQLVPFDFRLASGGTELVITPREALRPDAVHELVLAGDLHASDGRFLEQDHRHRFRTRALVGPDLLLAEPVDPPGAGSAGALEAGRPEVRLLLDAPVDPASLATASVTFVQVDLRIDAEVFLDSEVEREDLSDTLRVRPLAPLRSGAPVSLEIAGLDGAGGVPARAIVPQTFTVRPSAQLRTITSVEPSGALASTGGLRLRAAAPIDPGSVDPAAFQWTTNDGPVGAGLVEVSSDALELHVSPPRAFLPGSAIYLAVAPGAFRYRDGGPSAAWSHLTAIAQDQQPPRVTRSLPQEGASRFTADAPFLVEFDEDVVLPSPDRCALWVDEGEGFALRSLSIAHGASAQQLLFEPEAPLPLGARYRLEVASGVDGIRDTDGNEAPDLLLAGRVATETFPAFEQFPAGPETSLSPNSSILLRAGRALRRDSIATSVTILDDQDQPVTAIVNLLADERTLKISPVGAWTADVEHRIRLQAGLGGLSSADGLELGRNIEFAFRAGPTTTRAPFSTLEVESLPSWQAALPRVPDRGVRFTVGLDRGIGGPLDPSSVLIELEQDEGVEYRLDVRQLETLLPARADGETASYTFALEDGIELMNGLWQATLTVQNLDGIQSTPVKTSFQVVDASPASMPFERLQVVSVMFELDRDGNGLPDFREDLVRLGLATGYDSQGLDADLEALIRDGILTRAHALYRRGPDGERLQDEQSVAIRFVDGKPRGTVSMEVACGGLDPEAESGRVAGDPSSGTLGRAFFDAKNQKPGEHATALSPGLGVFPGEVFLYEARIAMQLGSGLRTGFLETFGPLSPAFGGEPLGTRIEDPIVLDPDFDHATATSRERARYLVLMQAADQWATVIGTILAHEVGHGVGLTEPGDHPVGLHGDASLHNADAAPTDVMNPTLGFDAMVRLDFSFRELNLAYLLHRVVIE